ncbi:MAG TPA: chondroitinase-B domain-containing protein [Chitinophagaceae bacterium]|jgi:hypothetical protein|nr:chondroitinase-B domain-containing protein [Chitinophagaceae bacterium]
MKNNFILNQLIADPYKKFFTTAFHFSKQFRYVLKKTLSFLLLLSVFKTVPAATITVSSLLALQTAINNAVPGDVIILINGVYTSSVDITISKKGTAAQPITIAAQTIGGAEITGTGGFSVVSPAAYIIIKGFKFTHAANHAKMGSGTSFCRWTRNIFETPGEGEYLLLNGNDHQIDYNTFQNKHNLGRFIAVRGSGSQIAQRLWIHHNYFLKQFPGGGNGAETLQFGLSGYSLSSSNSIVEHNLFEQCDGENELLSVKASAVIIRYNTIRDCPAQFTLRHGNRCVVYGNYFINTPGLRIYGDDHVIFSNHFENCSIALDIGNGDGEVADGDALTVHDRPDRVLIAFNTLVNNSSNFKQGGRTNGLGATYITVVNNIVQGGGAAASIAGPYTNPSWEGNIIFNTNGAGAMPATGYIIADPKIARNLTGTFHIQPGSPAIDAATGSYTSVIADMDGQARISPLDVGADEISNAQVIARILNSGDVGHTAISDAPSININSPIDKSILNGDSTISITADAISFDGTITKVEFFVDGSKIGEDTISPYNINWLSIEGIHTLTAKATDDKGNESFLSAVVVSVNPPGAHIKITAPINASNFVAPANITIDAQASDDINTITKLEFFNGPSKIGEDITSPYSFTWTNVTVGNYVLQAKATNNLGKMSLSVPVNITVSPGQGTSFDITDNGGIITAQYPNTTKPSEDFPSLIDNNKSTKYYRSGRTALWVQYQSSVPAIVIKYTITSANDVPNRDPRDWNLQGSNNGTTWTILDIRSGQTFSSRFLTKTYSFTNTIAYVYYRLNITNNNGETGTQFAEWELYEKRNQTISFDEIPDPTYGDDPFQLTANSNSGLPVDFEIVSGPATVDQNGLLTIIGAGTVTVRANQAGNDNYFPASAEQTFTINKAPQNISFETIADKTYGDAPFELVASADTHLPLVFAVVSGPATISGSMLTITGAGEVIVRVSQAGNENYLPAVEEQDFLVNKALQTISFTAIDPKNKIEIIQLSASSSSGLPVSFSVLSGPGVIMGNNLSFTDAGQVIVRASQPGNENYLAAVSVDQTILVYGMDEKKDGIKVIVYPNPTHGQIKVKLDNKKDKEYTITIYNDKGKPIASTIVEKSFKMFEVNFNINQTNGIYYLHVTDGTEVFVVQILKY